MARLFQGEVQIVTDDNMTTEKVQAILEKALHHLKISDVFVRETNYLGDIEEEEEDDFGP